MFINLKIIIKFLFRLKSTLVKYKIIKNLDNLLKPFNYQNC